MAGDLSKLNELSYEDPLIIITEQMEFCLILDVRLILIHVLS